jgi:hypothetical protein
MISVHAKQEIENLTCCFAVQCDIFQNYKTRGPVDQAKPDSDKQVQNTSLDFSS